MPPDDLESALEEAGFVSPRKPDRSGSIGPQECIYQTQYSPQRRLHLNRCEVNGITMYQLTVWAKNVGRAGPSWYPLRSIEFSRKAVPAFVAAAKALEGALVSGA